MSKPPYLMILMSIYALIASFAALLIIALKGPTEAITFCIVTLLGTMAYNVVTGVRLTGERTKQMSLFTSENPNPMLRISVHQQILYANIAGRNIIDRMGGIPESWGEIIRQTLQSGERFEMEMNKEDYWFIWLFVPVVAGKYVNVYGRETTLRKRVEDALEESRNFVERITEAIPDLLHIYDLKEQRNVYANRETGVILGYTPTEIQAMGSSLYATLIHPDDLPAITRQQVSYLAASDDDVIESEYRVRHSSGKWRWLSTRVVIFSRDAEGMPRQILGVAQDTTQRKAADEALARVRDEALESSRLKSEFLATMSHEIRTPMNGILGMLELLLTTKLVDEQQEFATIAFNESQTLLRIINDILDFSKIEAGKVILEKTDFQLINVIESAIEPVMAKAKEKKLSLMTFVSPEIAPVLNGDPNRLRQILVNLIGNAVKFTHDGEIIVKAAPLNMAQNRATLHFSVADTGIGLSEVARKRLFQPFTQADGSTTRKYGGTGLGLTISRRLVELMGGKIGVESAEGKGSTFWFELTLDYKPAPLGMSAEAASNDMMRVLVVDDLSSQREVIRLYLEAWGINVTEADGGEEALAILQSNVDDPFSVVLMDYMMPLMNGFELAQKIGEHPLLSTTPMILLTAFDEHGLGKSALAQHGFDSYLTKPIKQHQLRDAIIKAATGLAVNQPSRTLPPILEAARTGKKILIAEDNAVNREVAVLQLESLGYTVQAVPNGRAAVEAVLQSNENYGLVLMDCQMPVLDGLEATRRIRLGESAPRHTPIIAMTANAMPTDRERCIAAGMDDFISKPVGINDLREIIERWLHI